MWLLWAHYGGKATYTKGTSCREKELCRQKKDGVGDWANLYMCTPSPPQHRARGAVNVDLSYN